MPENKEFEKLSFVTSGSGARQAAFPLEFTIIILNLAGRKVKLGEHLCEHLLGEHLREHLRVAPACR